MAHNEAYLRSLDGVHQIAKLSGHAAEVLRTLSSRLIVDEVE